MIFFQDYGQRVSSCVSCDRGSGSVSTVTFGGGGAGLDVDGPPTWKLDVVPYKHNMLSIKFDNAR